LESVESDESVESAEDRRRLNPAAGALIAQVAARVAELARAVRELELLVEPGAAEPFDPAAGPGAEPGDGRTEFDLFARESHLTGREAEVLRHLLEGHSNRRISRSLHISESTVKNHLHAIFVKLDTRDRTQLIAKVYRFMAEHDVRAQPPRMPRQGAEPQVSTMDDTSA
jgi:DNA-binding NarL/FixJ family response regulator